LYGAFVALGLYFLLAKKDISTAMSNFGIALIFDPFDQKVMWQNRSLYQRVWLIVHLSIVFGLVGIMLFNWLSK
jgi:H+/Cl- antiporter ClcA